MVVVAGFYGKTLIQRKQQCINDDVVKRSITPNRGFERRKQLHLVIHKKIIIYENL